MLISVEKRFVFVANTKTASTSIEAALGEYAEIHRDGTPARKHTPLHEVLESYDFVFSRPEHTPERFFKFGVMRDPIEWILSWYRYRRGNQVESPLPQDLSFADFWARKDWNIERPQGAGKNLQKDLFCAPDGRVLADAILPYHQLGELFGQICDELGINNPLPRHNVSVLQDHEDLPQSLLEEMRAFYAADYALMDQLDTINAEALSRLRSGAFRSCDAGAALHG